jgi:STE24 endopeptidase
MSIVRPLIFVLFVAVVCAVIVGTVARTPTEVRVAEPDPNATDPDNGAAFSDEQIARHGAYRGPLYLALAFGLAVEIVALVALARGPYRTVLERLPGPWFVQAALAGVLLGVVLWLVALPIAYVRGYSIPQAWGLSTQDTMGWLSDQLKGAGISAVMSAIAVMAFIGIQRWQPRWWWLIGWVVFSALTALLTFIFPIVIAPLFNKFTPVDEALATRVRQLASRAGVEVDQVLVSDASRRTTQENAYVAGLGATKRVVLDDTLLAAGDERETMFVVAHELGHEAESHLLKFVVVSTVGLFIAFGVLAWLGSIDALWRWAGATGPGDLRALPLVALIAVALGVLGTPLQSTLSRNFEARADEIALELTEDPDTAVRAFRRLAFANLADLDPHPVAVALLYTHPPIPERIRSAVAGNL